jgi:hypothetical protein
MRVADLVKVREERALNILRFKEASRKLESGFLSVVPILGQNPEANMEEGFIC